MSDHLSRRWRAPGRLVFGRVSVADQGDANNATQGATNAKLEVRRFETGYLVATAVTPCRSLAAGMTFKFSDHPRYAGDYLVTGVSFKADFGAIKPSQIVAS